MYIISLMSIFWKNCSNFFIKVENSETIKLCLTNGDTAILTNIPLLDSKQSFWKEGSKEMRSR